jgi:hypothetical protein
MAEMVAYLAIDNAQFGEVCLLVRLVEISPQRFGEGFLVFVHSVRELTQHLTTEAEGQSSARTEVLLLFGASRGNVVVHIV